MITFEEALDVIAKAHANQADKHGNPYTELLITIAQNLKAAGEPEDVCILALLQNTLGEQTNYSKEKLLEAGVPEEMIAKIESSTHFKDQGFIDEYSCKLMAESVPAEEATYEAREKEFLRYIEQVKQDPVMRKIKIETMKCMLDEKYIPRNERRETKTKFRIKKYKAALEALQN